MYFLPEPQGQASLRPTLPQLEGSLGLAGGRRKSVAKDAGRARVDEGLDACRHRLFQQIERAGDVGVDEILPAVGRDMRFVQGGRMEDRLHAAHAPSYARAVGYRADVSGERRADDVEADDFVLQAFQRAGQGLAKVTGATCNQDFHALRHFVRAVKNPARP